MTGMARENGVLAVLPKPLGDLVLCTPALRYLRRALPNRLVVWQGSRLAKDLLEGTGWADDFFDNGKMARWKINPGNELPGGGFDGIVLFSNSFYSALQSRRTGGNRRIGYRRDGRGLLLTHAIEPVRLTDGWMPVSMIDYYGHLVRRAVAVLGGDTATPWDDRMELAVTPAGVAEIDRLMETWALAGDAKLAALVIGGAFGPSKLWPAERFGKLADWLTREGWRPVLIVSPGETAIARQVMESAQKPLLSLADHPVSVAGLKELVRRCGLMVGNDTGPAHIAAAFGLPLVTLFGPTDPRWTATGYGGEIRLRRNVDCGPCQEKVCKTDHRCLEGIEVAAVEAAVREVLARPERLWGQWPALTPRTRFSVYDELYEPLADGCGVVHKNYRALLEAAGLASLAGLFGCRLDQTLPRLAPDPANLTRLSLRDEAGRPVTLCLTCYGRRFFPAVPGGARRVFTRLLRRAQAGESVARPVAFGVERGWSGERRGFVLVEEGMAP